MQLPAVDDPRLILQQGIVSSDRLVGHRRRNARPSWSYATGSHLRPINPVDEFDIDYIFDESGGYLGTVPIDSSLHTTSE